jgi:hypothetical protein
MIWRHQRYRSGDGGHGRVVVERIASRAHRQGAAMVITTAAELVVEWLASRAGPVAPSSITRPIRAHVVHLAVAPARASRSAIELVSAWRFIA